MNILIFFLNLRRKHSFFFFIIYYTLSCLFLVKTHCHGEIFLFLFIFWQFYHVCVLNFFKSFFLHLLFIEFFLLIQLTGWSLFWVSSIKLIFHSWDNLLNLWVILSFSAGLLLRILMGHICLWFYFILYFSLLDFGNKEIIMIWSFIW